MLEQIVRPFTARQLFGEKRVPSSAVKEQTQESKMIWGAVGNLPSATQSAEPGPAQPIDFVVKGLNQKNVQQASANVMERIKIQQDGNPDNFVVYERPKSLTFKDPKPQPLKTPEIPVGTDAHAEGVPTGFKPGPGDPPEQLLQNPATEIPFTNRPVEIPLPGARGAAIAYNASLPSVKFDTHEYQFSYPPPGPNESPADGGAGAGS